MMTGTLAHLGKANRSRKAPQLRVSKRQRMMSCVKRMKLNSCLSKDQRMLHALLREKDKLQTYGSKSALQPSYYTNSMRSGIVTFKNSRNCACDSIYSSHAHHVRGKRVSLVSM